jgi:AraC-like DNA-binding protein
MLTGRALTVTQTETKEKCEVIMTGYIKIHREIMDHWIYKDAEYFKVWAEMLLRARHSREPKTDLHHGIKYTVNYAQFIYGRKEWSKRLGISEQRLRGLFKKLIDDNMIKVVEHLPRMTIVEVINYEKYNHPDNHVPDIEPSGNTDIDNQQDNHHVTTTQPPRNHHVTTKEECKECNNDNIYIYIVFEFWNEQKIIAHRKLTDRIKRKISGALRDYALEEIKTAIQNYATILKGKEYYWTHKWTLEEFLQRGLEKFLTDACFENFKNKKDDTEPRYRYVPNFEEHEHDDDFYNKFFNNKEV